MATMGFERQWRSIYGKLNEFTEKTLQATTYDIAERIIDELIESAEFMNVTGNLINSYAVGVYRNKSLVLMAMSADSLDSPTMRTLRPGQKYYFKYYWNGKVNWGYRKPYGSYIAPKDSPSKGRYYANERAEKMVHSYIPKTIAWTIYVVSGAEYASYVEEKGGHDVLTGVHKKMRRLIRV